MGACIRVGGRAVAPLGWLPAAPGRGLQALQPAPQPTLGWAAHSQQRQRRQTAAPGQACSSPAVHTAKPCTAAHLAIQRKVDLHNAAAGIGRLTRAASAPQARTAAAAAAAAGRRHVGAAGGLSIDDPPREGGVARCRHRVQPLVAHRVLPGEGPAAAAAAAARTRAAAVLGHDVAAEGVVDGAGDRQVHGVQQGQAPHLAHARHGAAASGAAGPRGASAVGTADATAAAAPLACSGASP